MSDSLGDRLDCYFREGPPSDSGIIWFVIGSLVWWRILAFFAVVAAANVVLLVSDSATASAVVLTIGFAWIAIKRKGRIR